MLKANCVRTLAKPPVTVEDSSIVYVEDEFGNPLVVVVYVAPKVCTIVTADDPDFNSILAGLGIDKIVLNEPLRTSANAPNGARLIGGPRKLIQ